jgi:hypothetical protein
MALAPGGGCCGDATPGPDGGWAALPGEERLGPAKNEIYFKNFHHINKLINYNSEEVNRTQF